jgi:hypothetical protein
VRILSRRMAGKGVFFNMCRECCLTTSIFQDQAH